MRFLRRLPSVPTTAILLLIPFLLPSQTRAADAAGAKLFKEHCAVCHPDGGNIVTPKKTLQRKDREANGIKTESDIVRLMRKPGPGMNVFDERTMPDAQATEIANYIIKTFTK